MPANRFYDPFPQKFNTTTGAVGAGWKLYFYVGGSSTTLQDTYSDTGLSVPNTNPVVADSAGLFGDIFLDSGLSYAVKLTDENDVQIDYASYIQEASSTQISQMQREVQVGSAAVGQVFTLTSFTYSVGDTQNLLVFQNGELLEPGPTNDYEETSSSSITVNSAITINPGDKWTFLKNVASATVANAANIIYTPSGVGAVTTNVKAELDAIGSIISESSGIVTVDATSEIRLKTASTDRVTVDSSGNVGIGTTTITYKTTVADDLAVQSASTPSLRWINGSTPLFNNYCDVATQALVWYDNVANVERMRLDSSGNVGIGLTSPGAKLDVQADASTGVSQSDIQVTVPDSIGNRAGFGVANPSGGTLGGIAAEVVATGAYPNSIGRVDIFVQSGATTTTALTALASGNVGIGTSSPGAKLDISDGLTARFKIAPGSTTITQSSRDSSDTGYVSCIQDAIQHIFQASSTEAMRIDTAGNVGIGTTSPASALELEGVGNATNITLDNTTATTGRSYSVRSGNTGNLDFYDNDATTARLTINSSGDVGIGITSPNSKLELRDNTQALLSWGDTAAIGSLTFDGSSQPVVRALDGKSLVFQTNGNTEQMRINTAGNVGIGTSSPSQTLHVDGDTLFYNSNGSTANYYFEADHFCQLQITGDNDASAGGPYSNQIVTSGANGDLQFRNNSNINLVLDYTGGNLLLGGTTVAASSVGNLHLFNGTAPTGSVTDGVILYSEDVTASAELKVRDEAGNVTTLSPHNFSLIPDGPSEEMAWAYYSEKDGKRINVDMLKLARMVEKLTGEKLVYED